MNLDTAAAWPAALQRLYARIEDAGLNASATPQQLWLDGWLLRLSPGKAQRARCVNALAPGRSPLDEQLHRVKAVYAQHRLPLIVRITPFSQPAELDAALNDRGLVAYDDTRVMVCADAARFAAAAGDDEHLPAGYAVHSVGVQAFAQAIGTLRGSTLLQQQAHAQRLELSPLAWRAVVMRSEAEGRVVAVGQACVEGDLVGLYDVNTDPALRNRGLATALCRHILRRAVDEAGARTAYLQVDADNTPARAIYARLGFIDAYRYHYRALKPG